MRLSIIISNYNYGDFVGAAIESALAVDWADKEVIVVDESTDDSRSIIEGFGDRIVAYFRPKSNQLSAHRFGFEQSTGDIIIFLDSDDLLEPEVMREVARVWRPGVSKVQYRMNLIDADGTQLGSALPQFPSKDDPQKLRRAFLRTMAYTTPPGSGNAYSREFAGNALALAPSTMWSTDDLLLILAPISGDVLTIRKPLARYRIHTRNAGGAGSLEAEKFRLRLRQDIGKAGLFVAVCQQLGLTVPRDPLRASLNHLQYRLASYLVEPLAHPFPEDTKWSIVYQLASSAAKSTQMPLRDRATLVVWTIACALAPSYYLQKLVLWRFVATSRPAVIRTVLGALSSLRSRRLPNPVKVKTLSN